MDFIAGTSIVAKKRKPNFLVVLIDDLRFDELGICGHPYMKTPHIDRIGHEGAMFTSAFHTTPLCSPNRASILTGQYASRHGIIDNVARDAHSHRLPNYHVILQRLGYETAHIGKWHLQGHGEKGTENFPQKHGFDINIAGDHTGTPRSYFAPFGGKGFDYRDEFFRVHEPYSRQRVRVLLSIDTEKTDLKQAASDEEREQILGLAVDEFLRFESSNQLGNRRALQATQVNGMDLPAGALVTLCIGAANRDPAVYDNPEQLNLRRTGNKHLAFGFGVHQCAGLSLARLEGRIAIGRFLQRFPNYQLTQAPQRGGRARFRGFLHAPFSIR